jgi:hypothetical protein
VARVHGVPEGLVVFEGQGGDFEEARHVCIIGGDGDETHVGYDLVGDKIIDWLIVILIRGD